VTVRYGLRFTGRAATIVATALSNCRLGCARVGREQAAPWACQWRRSPLRVTVAATKEDTVIEGSAPGRSDTHS